MKTLLHALLMVVALGANSSYGAETKPDGIGEAMKIAVKSKTIGAFNENAKSLIGNETYQFLKEKIKGQENAALSIVRSGPMEITIDPKQTPLKVMFGENSEGVPMVTLNGHSVLAGQGVTLEKFFDDLLASMPKTAAHSFSIFPEAHAGVVIFRIAATLIGAAAVTIVGSLGYSEMRCKALDADLTMCQVQSKAPIATLEKWAKDDMDRSGPLTRCQKREDLQKCLQRQVTEQHLSVSEPYREYFKQIASAATVSAGAPNTAPAAK